MGACGIIGLLGLACANVIIFYISDKANKRMLGFLSCIIFAAFNTMFACDCYRQEIKIHSSEYEMCAIITEATDFDNNFIKSDTILIFERK